MSKVKKTLKILRSLNRSQVLVALFLGTIILLSTVNLIRDLRSYGLKPFGFVESAFAQIFPQDNVLAQALPKAGDSLPSLCGSKIDLLQYMFAENGAGYNLKYCTQAGPGLALQNLSLEKTTFEGKPAFKLHKGNDYELYYYDDQNIYFVEDTSWDGTCADGLRAYYRVFGANNQVGGAIPRCWSPGQVQVSDQKIKTYYRDSDTPTGKQCDPKEDFQVTTPTIKVDYASQGGNGPQVSSLYDNNGTVVMTNTAGAGAGEEKYYSKGYGLTGFFFSENNGTTQFHSSIQTDDVDPDLVCDKNGVPSITDAFKSPKDDIVDSPDRCIASNPRTGKPLRSINSGGGTSLDEGKGGINQGNLGWNNEIQFVQGNNSLKRDLKMGSILGLFLDDNPGPAASFVKDANDAGLLPVVRLCYSGSCGFDINNESIPNYYKALSDAVTILDPGYVFVGLLGPNEPGTGGEMQAFQTNSYATLVSQANHFATELGDYRVKIGGNMYLAPAAFNINNRDPNGDDVKEYLLNGRGLDLNLFDYLAGNTYNDGNASAYDNYVNSQMKQVVDSNGLKTIITEFGRFDSSNEKLKTSFMKFCDDSNVDGVLFFRSFEDGELGAGQPKPLPVPISVIYDMTSSCSKPRPWVDCNFDSTLYADNVNKKSNGIDSTARSVYKKTEDKSANVTFKVGCGGDNCDIKITQTMRLRAPIKEFGSNSSFGTETKNFTPICVNAASITSSKVFDPLNQFAGKVGDNYAMPWLGSAINCSAEYIKSSGEYAGIPGLQQYNSPGSVVTNTTSDIDADISKQVVARQYDGSSCLVVEKDGKNYISDERAVYYKGQLIDKCPVEAVKIIRYYNPFSTPVEYTSVPESGTGLKYLKNPDDYIYGPEVELTSDVVQNIGDFSQMCSQYAERNRNPAIKYIANSTLDCKPKSDFVDGISCDNNFANCTQDKIQNGSCQLNKDVPSNVLDDLRNNCFEYSPKDTDKIYYREGSFADLPEKMDIPNVYDSLNMLYQRLNDSLKNRNMKLIVNNNIGWDVEGYSILRDGNSESKGSKTSLYTPTDEEKTYYSDIQGDATATATVTVPKLFDNRENLARGTSSSTTKKTDYYYDWLGYLDIFQEYYSVYQNNTTLDGEQRIPNPFYNQVGFPNSDEQYILLSGLASQYVSLPLLSCDQRNIGNTFSNSDLAGSAAVRLKLQGYLQETNPQLTGDAVNTAVNRLIDAIWPYDYTISNKDATCITDVKDTRVSNKLETELCKRGYTVTGACGNKCTNPNFVPTTPTTPISSPTTPTTPTTPVVTTPGFSPIFPTQTTEVFSPYGCEQQRKGDCHTGVDFKQPIGTSIVAADAGTVILAGSDRGTNKDGQLLYQDCFLQVSGSYGCLVKIKHSNGFVTLYAHMSQVLVSEGQVVTKGQEIGKVGMTGYADGPHLHFEIRSKGDCYDGTDLGKCTEDPMKYLSGTATEDFIAACQPEDYTVTPWKGSCDEWNCGGSTSFQNSLSCITGIGYFHGSMDEWIDRYGPFCDNEAYATKVLPFAYNFTQFYDKYLPPGTTGGRTCSELPPNQPRPGDQQAFSTAGSCKAFQIRSTGDFANGAYEYYRGALKRCSVPIPETNWTADNSFGKTPEDLADYMMNTLDVTYAGLHLKNTPREKVVNVLQAAHAKNLNPFIVIGIWGTESWFGQYNKQCNIIQ